MSWVNEEAIGVIESIRGELRGSFIFMLNYRAKDRDWETTPVM